MYVYYIKEVKKKNRILFQSLHLRWSTYNKENICLFWFNCNDTHYNIYINKT